MRLSFYLRAVCMAVPVVLASCGTPEFRAEQAVCTSEWMQKIPPRYEQELYNKSMSRQVPTGRTSCITHGYSTTCRQEMRTEYYTVPAIRTVDRNLSRRKVQIDVCTQQTCVEKFGNVECKAAG